MDSELKRLANDINIDIDENLLMKISIISSIEIMIISFTLAALGVNNV